ncbi:CCN family member 2-like isoform X1 [Styela clava]
MMRGEVLFLVFILVTKSFGMEEEATTSSEEYSMNSEDIGNESERDLYPAERKSGLCRQCSCPPIASCPTGVSFVMDGCGCCKICAGQLGDRCDREKVCDHHKGLHCDGNTGTCKARPGRSCFVANKWYENGALFSPSCRITCSCINGDIGCMPKCKPPPPGCAYPKLIRSTSNCCGQWRCNGRPSEYARGKESALSFRGSCLLQTIEWSACSKSCGFGVSERVTNDNEDCKMTKETRLCIVRPCTEIIPPRKSKRSCRRNMRRTKRVRYSLSGCLTVKSFKPRYCGTCRHSDKCCRPSATKTAEIEFRCDTTSSEPDSPATSYTMKRKLMVIQNCECGKFCDSNEFAGNSVQGQLIGDTYRDT